MSADTMSADTWKLHCDLANGLEARILAEMRKAPPVSRFTIATVINLQDAAGRGLLCNGGQMTQAPTQVLLKITWGWQGALALARQILAQRASDAELFAREEQQRIEEALRKLRDGAEQALRKSCSESVRLLGKDGTT